MSSLLMDVDTIPLSLIQAEFPFNRSPPNIVFRCSDGVLLPLHKDVLAHISEYFQKMFRRIQASANPDPDSIPVVNVPEDGQSLRRFMLHGYPGRAPPFKSFEDSERLIKIADKYESGDIMATLVEQLPKEKSQALQVYALAVRHGLGALAKEAAFRLKDHLARSQLEGELGFKRWENTKTARSYIPDIPAGAFHRLVRFVLDLGAPPKSFISPLDDWSKGRYKETLTVPPTTNADLIVVSLEGDKFPFHSAILSMASSVFEHMVKEAICSLHASGVETLPVMEIQQSTSIARLILGLLHPAGCPILPESVLGDVPDLLQAAFELRITRIINMSHELLKYLAQVNPLHAYLAALTLRLEDEIQFTAHRCIHAEVRYPLSLEYVPAEMEHIPSNFYYPLVKYCFQYRRTLTKIAMLGFVIPEDNSENETQESPIPDGWYGQLMKMDEGQHLYEAMRVCLFRFGHSMFRDIHSAHSIIAKLQSETAELIDERLSEVELELEWDRVRSPSF